jgi:hypothetical protein
MKKIRESYVEKWRAELSVSCSTPCLSDLNFDASQFSAVGILQALRTNSDSIQLTKVSTLFFDTNSLILSFKNLRQGHFGGLQ